MSFEEGPYIQAACFCDMVIEDKSGTLSLIRIIDTLNTSVEGQNPPEEMPPVQKSLTMVLMLKSGNARGRWNVKIVPEIPTGETKEPLFLTAHFDGEEKGNNIVANINFTFQYEGLYWFSVYIDDDKLTSIPIRVKYHRIATMGQPG